MVMIIVIRFIRYDKCNYILREEVFEVSGLHALIHKAAAT